MTTPKATEATEEAKHTREPWHVANNGLYRTITGSHYLNRGEEVCTVVARVEGNLTSQFVTQANANRIVACVNACAGIPNEQLPTSFCDLANACNAALMREHALLSRLAAAEAENAKLRSVIERLPHHETCPSWKYRTHDSCTCGKYAALSSPPESNERRNQ